MDVYKLVSFRNHPFKVLQDIQMVELMDSIEANGILVPLIVRRLQTGRYEIISGHR